MFVKVIFPVQYENKCVRCVQVVVAPSSVAEGAPCMGVIMPPRQGALSVRRITQTNSAAE